MSTFPAPVTQRELPPPTEEQLNAPQFEMPPAVGWAPEIEEFLARHADYAAAQFTLDLLAQAQCAVFYMDAQPLYVRMRDGHIFSKYISTDGLRAAHTYETFDTGWMPSNIMRSGITSTGRWAVEFIPAQTYELDMPHQPGSAERDERERTKLYIALPAFVLMGFRSTYYIWAVKEKHFNPDAQIYHAPVPNIWGDGHICFGGNTPPEVEGPNLDAAWDLFLRSPYTCAHIQGRSLKFHQHICDALFHHAGRTRANPSFPRDDLVPYLLTVAEAVERIVANEPMPSSGRLQEDGTLIYGFNEN